MAAPSSDVYSDIRVAICEVCDLNRALELPLLFTLCVRSQQCNEHITSAQRWHSLIPLKACVWSPSDLFPCLAVFSHANQSAFNLNIHEPNLQPVFGAAGSSEGESATFIFSVKGQKKNEVQAERRLSCVDCWKFNLLRTILSLFVHLNTMGYLVNNSYYIYQ